MTHSWCARRVGALMAPLLLVAGAVGATVTLWPSAAGAVSCGSAVSGSCTATGTLRVTPGALTLTAPSALGWNASLSGLNQSLVDTSGSDEVAVIDDATGSGAGWKVTVSATQFTNGSALLPNTGTLSLNGSLTSATATTAPSYACATNSTCVLPVPEGGLTYPVQFTTAATSPTPYEISDAGVASGMGTINFGGSSAANPIGWWLNVPSSVVSGSYLSTVTATIATGP